MSEPPAETPAPRCAICGKPQDPKFKPFCSKRCANIDLSRWLKGSYTIPGRAEEEGEGGRPKEPGEGGPSEEPDEGG